MKFSGRDVYVCPMEHSKINIRCNETREVTFCKHREYEKIIEIHFKVKIYRVQEIAFKKILLKKLENSKVFVKN